MKVVEAIHQLPEETRILSPRTNSNLLLINICPPWSSKTDFFCLFAITHSQWSQEEQKTEYSLTVQRSTCHDTIHGQYRAISLPRIRVRITVILELLGLLLTSTGEAQEYVAYIPTETKWACTHLWYLDYAPSFQHKRENFLLDK